MTSTTDRFADDPAFAVHEGGKLSVRTKGAITSIADLALTYTPGVARVSSAIAAEPELARPLHLGPPRRSRSCPTAPPCWAWVTSARRPRCR